MIPNDDKISGIQVGIFIYLTVLGVGILTLPASVVKAAENDAWLVTLVSGLLSLIFIYLMCKVGEKYSQYGYVGTLKKLFGGFLGTLIGLVTFVHFLVFTAIELRIFGETTKLYLLTNTPLEFIILPLLLIAAVHARAGIEPIVRFFEFITPMVLFVLIIFILLFLPKSDYSNLRPFFSQEPIKYLKSIDQTIFAYAGYEILMVIFPFIRKPKEVRKPAIIAMLFITLLYTLVIIQVLARFGVKETQSLIYPTMTLVKSSDVPGAFIERTEGLMMALWILFIYTSVISFVYGLSVVGADVLKQRERKHIISLSLPLVYLIALQGDSVADVFKISDLLTMTSSRFMFMILPLLMFLISTIKKGRNRSNEG
ncbi:hypothetical protein Q428_00380 [Fervidicella metallireducens AeB]|uniref:Spore germination protein n=1 Tax=Fervidicella metallireducens AeB TaxID=1403537 RepID=A0A017RYL6_9CLOT|nr:endospore germination permease [Fervidicella metallireducens]EYE89873.1 hypothetical protein Q428_00380 [Fervidicella metallireducens AeB]